MIELNATLALVAGTSSKTTGENAKPDMKNAFDAALSLVPSQRVGAGVSQQGASRLTSDLVHDRSAFHIMYGAQTNIPQFVLKSDILGAQAEGVVDATLDAEIPEQVIRVPEIVENANDISNLGGVSSESTPYVAIVEGKSSEVMLLGLPDSPDFGTPSGQTSNSMSVRIAAVTSDAASSNAVGAVTGDTPSVGLVGLDPKGQKPALVDDAKVETGSPPFVSKPPQMRPLPGDIAQDLAPAMLKISAEIPAGKETSAVGPVTRVPQMSDGIPQADLISKVQLSAPDGMEVKEAVVDVPRTVRGVGSEMSVSSQKQDASMVEKSAGGQHLVVPETSNAAGPGLTIGSQDASKGLKIGMQDPSAVLPNTPLGAPRGELGSQTRPTAPVLEIRQDVEDIDKVPSVQAPSGNTQFAEKRAPQTLVQASSGPSALTGGLDAVLPGPSAERSGSVIPQGDLETSDPAATQQLPGTRAETGVLAKVTGPGLKVPYEGLSLGGFPREVTLRELRPAANSPTASGTDATSLNGPATSAVGALSVSPAIMPPNDRKLSQPDRFFPQDVSLEGSNMTEDSVYDVRDTLPQSGSSNAAPAGSMPLAVAQFAPIIADEVKAVSSVETDALLAMQTSGEIVNASTRGAESIARAPVPLVPQEVLKIAEQLRAGIRMDRYPLEIALDPPELGQVRMVLQTGEATTTLLIIADRPETADLMRRNASFLHDAFAQEGKGGLDLQFGTSADAERNSGRDGRSNSGSSQTVAPAASLQGVEQSPRVLAAHRNAHSSPSSGLNLTF